jgi:hypothetical protein
MDASSRSKASVVYLGVARLSHGKAHCIANYSSHAVVNLKHIKDVVEEPNCRLTQGKHYSFDAALWTWHLIQDEHDLIYVMIANQGYQLRVAHHCLQELQTNVSSTTNVCALQGCQVIRTNCSSTEYSAAVLYPA